MELRRLSSGKTTGRLCIVISAAFALVLGAALFTGRSGAWTFAFQIGFLTSVAVFLWLLVRLIAQRLEEFTSPESVQKASPHDPSRSIPNR